MKFKCDFGGVCKNKPFREVYPGMLNRKYADRGWSYLCKKHFYEEQKKFKGKIPWCSISRRKTKQLHITKSFDRILTKLHKKAGEKV